MVVALQEKNEEKEEDDRIRFYQRILGNKE